MEAASSSESAKKTPSSPEKNTPRENPELRKKISERLKKRFVNSIKNLDPRGKDKYWWAGTLLSAGLSTYYFLAVPGANFFVRSLVRAGVAAGAYAWEKTLYQKEKKKLKKEHQGEALTKKIADLQKNHDAGSSRLYRFLLGVTAGSAYSIILDAPFSLSKSLHAPSGEGTIKTMKSAVDKAKESPTRRMFTK